MSDESVYDGVRLREDDRRRHVLVAAAVDIISERGVEALSVRTLADAVGASTKVIYTHFGGKDGVIEAVYEDGFARLAARLAAAAEPAGTVRVRIERTIDAYRQFALDHPRFYELMYSPPVRSLRPRRTDRDAAAPSLDVLTGLFAEGEVTGELRPGDALARARGLWAGAHGVVSLELTDWFDADEARRRLSDTVDAQLEAAT